MISEPNRWAAWTPSQVLPLAVGVGTMMLPEAPPVINGLDLAVTTGECFGLLGPNGAGKTTAIAALCGLIEPQRGSMRICGIDCAPVSGELTYGLERLAMYIQGVESIYDLVWADGPAGRVTYGDVFHQNEVEMSRYNFEEADVAQLFAFFDHCESEALRLVEKDLPLPAYEMVMKASHTFNLLDARHAISVTERQRFILRVRTMARAVAEAYYSSREALGFPMVVDGTAGMPGHLQQRCLCRQGQYDTALTFLFRLDGAQLGGDNCPPANLNLANLTNASLIGANLHGVSMRDATLRNANLTGADLGEAQLAGSILRHADVTDTDFSDVDLFYVALTFSNFSQAKNARVPDWKKNVR